MKFATIYGEPVVDTWQLAKIFSRTASDMEQSYLKNKEKFQESKHYYLINPPFENSEESIQAILDESIACTEEIYLWTELGVYEHARILEEIQAWQAYCQFIHFVFKESKRNAITPLSENLGGVGK